MDCVVTVPKTFTHPCAPGLKGLAAWLAEGDAPGVPWSGQLWGFTTWGPVPDIRPVDRVYVVCEGRVVGYSPLVRLDVDRSRARAGHYPLEFVRAGGAVACTIPQPVIGFRGWRYRFWDRGVEVPLDLNPKVEFGGLFEEVGRG